MIRSRIRRPLDPDCQLHLDGKLGEERKGHIDMSPYGLMATEELDERRDLYSRLARVEKAVSAPLDR